ncbi:hypothetical protein SPB21_33010 [Leptothoe sp. ISB3NOV94-8A]|uniref:Uncharacterized protein n=2 Tax=Adonisia TaxID=2950183 RepID=A0A6M0RIF2_9CYAN|nr:hypothetical protein [Adonisia turfae]NEZ56038.1 hypothetical protein [Adonisia turfae CCMR0081]
MFIMWEFNEQALTWFRRQSVGFVFQCSTMAAEITGSLQPEEHIVLHLNGQLQAGRQVKPR